MTLALRRQFFAEELEAVCKLRSSALVEAFAAVPRESFLRPGPWTVSAESDFTFTAPSRTQTTPDADPRHVYHNIAIAIDPTRQLFNGQPGTLGVWLDALNLATGARVLHVGAGLGYYTAVMAQCVGPAGRIVAFEVDDTLATEARQNLGGFPSVDLRHGDASEALDEPFDAILVNAGVTHPLAGWLDALAVGGRMILPLTATMPAMGPTIGKGLVFLVTKQDSAEFGARVVSIAAIYSAVSVRDEDMNTRLGKALMGGPMQWQGVKRLRRDSHAPTTACWLHGPSICLSTA